MRKRYLPVWAHQVVLCNLMDKKTNPTLTLFMTTCTCNKNANQSKIIAYVWVPGFHSTHVTHRYIQTHICWSDFLPWTGQWDKNSLYCCSRGRLLYNALCTTTRALDKMKILRWVLHLGLIMSHSKCNNVVCKLYRPSVAEVIQLAAAFFVNQSLLTCHVWNMKRNC